MLGASKVSRTAAALCVPLVACSFGGSPGVPEPLGIGDEQQADTEAPPPAVDEPFGDEGGPGGDDGRGEDGEDGGPGEDGGADDNADDGDGHFDAGEDDGSAEAGEDDAGDDGEPAPFDCSQPFSEIYWAADAELEEPMALTSAPSAAGDPDVAYSAVAEEGTIAFTVDIPCAGNVYLHGLVWDLLPGAWANPDADSLYVDIGDGEEFIWRYGCQTLDMEHALSWQPLASLQAQPCVAQGIYVAVSAPGTYTMTIRNREPGDASAVAAIAALSISSDEDFDPHSLYEPY